MAFVVEDVTWRKNGETQIYLLLTLLEFWHIIKITGEAYDFSDSWAEVFL